MKILAVAGFLALAHTAHAQATPAKDSRDCVARMAAASQGGPTTIIESAKLQPGNPMPGLPAGEPSRFVVSVLVDEAGHADTTAIQLPQELDSFSANAIRTVLPNWRFVPAQVGTCPVKQVVKLTFQRK
jgi:hypothetical protein